MECSVSRQVKVVCGADLGIEVTKPVGECCCAPLRPPTHTPAQPSGEKNGIAGSWRRAEREAAQVDLWTTPKIPLREWIYLKEQLCSNIRKGLRTHPS